MAKLCPDSSVWQAFLGEEQAEGLTADLCHHVETCADCQHILETLAANPWEDATRSLSADQRAAVQEPALKLVMRQLKEAEAGLSGDGAALCLRPADRTGLLGYLGAYEVLEVIILLEPVVSNQTRGENCPTADQGPPTTHYRVKITDFGLVRAVDDAGISLEGMVAGTPEYMAPEQARGEAVDHRADLFGLGSVLYALCTGQPPFHGGPPWAVLRKVIEETPTPIREFNPEVPAWLETIVMRLLAKDPTDRFASAAEVATLLETQDPRGLAASGAPLLCQQSPRQKERRLRFRRWLPAAAAFLGIILAITETTGATALLDTVAILLRIRTPDGTVVEIAAVKDPPPALQHNGIKIGPPRLGPRPTEGKVFDQPVAIWAVPEANPACGVFTPDGRTLATGFWSGALVLWDVATGRKRASQRTPSYDMRALAVSPDGQTLATGTGDGVVRLWDVTSGELRHELTGHLGRVMGVAFSPDGGTLASVGGPENRPGQLRFWDLRTAKPTLIVPEFEMELWSLAYAPDGQTVAVAMGRAKEGKAAIVSTADGTTRMTLDIPAPVRQVALSPDGKHLALCYRLGGMVKILDFAGGKALASFQASPKALFTLAFTHEDKRLLTSSTDGTAILWDLEANKACRRATFLGHQGEVHFAAVSQDGRTLATGATDRTIRLWDLSGAE